MAGSDAALILFTLSPRAEGRRKSFAAGVAAALIARARSVSASLKGVDLLLSTPSRGHLPQRGRNFGESLRLAVMDAFALGYRRVVVIGNDAPEISPSYLRQAFLALSGSARRAVLGPAEDGGYNLIGLSAPCAAAFRDIPWGTGRVAEITGRILDERGFDVVRLETLADIDDAPGLQLFLHRVTASGCFELRRLARRLRNLSQPAVFPTLLRPILSVPAPARTGLLRAPPP